MLITNGKVFRNIAENQFSEYAAKGYKKVEETKKPKAEKPEKPKAEKPEE